MQTASTFLKLSPKEQVVDEWEVLNDAGHFGFDDLIAIVIGLFLFVLPGLLAIIDALTRPHRTGYLCLTNWRCLYYERGEGAVRNYHHVATTDLEDIVAIHSDYEEGLFGKKTLFLKIHTKFEDVIAIEIGDAGGPLAKLPGIGKLFRRESIGKDALKVPPALYSLVQQRRADVADSRATF